MRTLDMKVDQLAALRTIRNLLGALPPQARQAVEEHTKMSAALLCFRIRQAERQLERESEPTNQQPPPIKPMPTAA